MNVNNLNKGNEMAKIINKTLIIFTIFVMGFTVGNVLNNTKAEDSLIPSTTPTIVETQTVIPTVEIEKDKETCKKRNADLNNDGTVNIFDLSILLSQWTPNEQIPTPIN